ncbi:uncharacterized protein (UPF0548 family) [Kribbella aluminosa]|uniref:Uncharacterized protein (UPF0548 family) n=1 Tax=Kribbella aluminosa TaxID=416017 RepID=A0ABS4UND0_9ACTN|nr:DUF1990 domain-containing protein [Kribbella aluminosa]MBP2353153.1 uncharacterized protein (UPF0548 family) [Kribbella aluminosa]
MRANLSMRAPTDDTAGATLTGGVRCYHHTVRIGSRGPHWADVTTELLRWGVKTRSGFSIQGDPTVLPGRRYWLIARLGPFRIHEPVQVVAVVDEPTRVGFAYGTLAGHPVRGEETFLVERRTDGSVWLTLRSRTRPAPGLRSLVYPLALVAQQFYRWRYFRALR